MQIGQRSVRPKTNQYKVGWRAVEKAKLTSGRPMFSVWREKYFSWLVGHSQSIMDQVRLKVAAELAEAEIKQTQDLKLDRGTLINKYKEQLRNESISNLLEIGKIKERYVTKELQFFTNQNRKPIKSAILFLNEQYLDEIGKVIPLEERAKKMFVCGFIQSTMFAQNGGRTRVLSCWEMQDALLKYLGSGGKPLIDKNEIDKIEENRKEAYKEGEKVVSNLYREISKKIRKSAKNRIDHLRMVVDDKLKNNLPARMAAEHLIQTLFDNEIHKKRISKVNAILKMQKGIQIRETRGHYAKRICKEVKRQIGLDIELQKVANPMLERFMIMQESLQILEDLFREIPEYSFFRGFSTKEEDELKRAFREAFLNKVISLKRLERKQLDKTKWRSLANSIRGKLLSEKYKKLAQGSVFDMINIPFVNFLSQTGSEYLYFQYLPKIYQKTVATILKEAYNSFLEERGYCKREVDSYSAEKKQEIVDDFKEYFKGKRLDEKGFKDTAVHTAIDVMACEKDPRVQRLLRKLKIYFGISGNIALQLSCK